jgi:BirA family biotin operon repressor/biotin-[acetyl-CoA-carboxylase] ligase
VKLRKATRRTKNGFDLARLRAGMKPFRLLWFASLRSTSDHAARLRKMGKLFAPAVVVCGRQTAGRGRGKNTWWSNSDSIAATFVLPIHDRLPPQQLPLLAGLALREAAVALTGVREIQLKWPNDLMHDGRKLAGLLCERVGKADLVGIGLNVNVDPQKAPAALRGQITSLLTIGGKAIDLTNSLIAIGEQLNAIIRRRAEQPFSVFVKEFNRHDALVGKTVTIIGHGDDPAIVGKCEGVDDFGRLLVRCLGTLHRILAGQVSVRPAARSASRRV